MFALIEHMCKCTRAAFWRAGVQETIVDLKRRKHEKADNKGFW